MAAGEWREPQTHRAVFEHIDAHFDDYIAELRDFLRQPGISATGQGMAESARAALDFLALAGTGDAELVPTDGYPVATGHLRSRNPDARTLIIYSLYDEVPVNPADWLYPPHGAEVVPAAAIGAPGHVGEVIVARAALNQRGPMVALIAALRSMLAVEKDIPVNVLWVWEGEEEIGCPHLPQFIERRLQDLKTADAWWVPCFREDELGRTVDVHGYKGTVKLQMRIRGGEWGGTLDGKDIWSANLPLVDAPMWRLVRALASLVDADDRLAVDGLWEKVRPYTREERAELDIVLERLDEAALKASLPVTRFKNGLPARTVMERFIMEPMLNVIGISGGYTGPSFMTTLPMDVSAKLDVRFTPNLSQGDIVPLLRAHLDRRGFEEVKLIRLEGGFEWSRTPSDAAIYRAGKRAALAHGADYLVWPTFVAVNPSSMFNRPPLSLPCSYMGMGHGARFHQGNEYCAIEGVRRLMKYSVTFLHQYAVSDL